MVNQSIKVSKCDTIIPNVCPEVRKTRKKIKFCIIWSESRINLLQIYIKIKITFLAWSPDHLTHTALICCFYGQYDSHFKQRFLTNVKLGQTFDTISD